MRAKDILDLVILAAVWGASFLFMRIAVPEFGPIAMIELRVVIATLFLLPVLLLRDSTTALRTNWKKLFAIGAVNSAVPFCLLAYSTLFLSAGFAAILNATAPLFAAVIAWAWLSERLNFGLYLYRGPEYAEPDFTVRPGVTDERRGLG